MDELTEDTATLEFIYDMAKKRVCAQISSI